MEETMNKENFAFNEKIIEEFRANEGKVAMFAGMPMIILHTIGRKSGKTLLVPLVLTVKKEGEMLLFGSFAGAKNDPAWVHNLRVNPTIDVEIGTGQFSSQIEELSAGDAKEACQRTASNNKTFAGYMKSAAPRDIPVFRVTRL
jgi:deazaflavin-dependent oxidoreductase (nitroreductase family)